MPRKKPDAPSPRAGASKPKHSLTSTTPDLSNAQRLDAQAVRREQLLAHPKAGLFINKLMQRALGEDPDAAPAVINKATEMVGNVILGKGGDEAQALQKQASKEITLIINGQTYDPINRAYVDTPDEADNRQSQIERLRGAKAEAPVTIAPVTIEGEVE